MKNQDYRKASLTWLESNGFTVTQLGDGMYELANKLGTATVHQSDLRDFVTVLIDQENRGPY